MTKEETIDFLEKNLKLDWLFDKNEKQLYIVLKLKNKVISRMPFTLD
jgi:hypothetical protein